MEDGSERIRRSRRKILPFTGAIAGLFAIGSLNANNETVEARATAQTLYELNRPEAAAVWSERAEHNEELRDVLGILTAGVAAGTVGLGFLAHVSIKDMEEPQSDRIRG